MHTPHEQQHALSCNEAGVHFVVGDPIAHSFSPLIYNTLYEYYEMNVRCTKAHVSAEQLPAFLSLHKQLDVTGFNITVPHKSAVLPFLDAVTDEASAQASVNCIAVQQGRLVGHSTDGWGFSLALQEQGAQLPGQHIVLLGAGGAAAAIAERAAVEGAASIVFLARNKEKAQQLAQRIARRQACPCTGDALSEMAAYLPQADLLVQCTSLGMEGYGQDYSDLSFLSLLPRSAAVCDIVYRPSMTRFLGAASEQGHAIIGGIGMLIWQALACFQILYGVLPGKEQKLRIEAAFQAAGYAF